MAVGEAETVTSSLRRHGLPWLQNKGSLVVPATPLFLLLLSLLGGFSIIGALGVLYQWALSLGPGGGCVSGTVALLR